MGCSCRWFGSSTQLAVGTVRVVGVGTCTLLGPEGPGADCGSLGLWLVAVPLGPFPGVTVVACRGGYRPYFENYTVDASIFHAAFWGCVV